MAAKTSFTRDDWLAVITILSGWFFGGLALYPIVKNILRAHFKPTSQDVLLAVVTVPTQELKPEAKQEVTEQVTKEVTDEVIEGKV